MQFSSPWIERQKRIHKERRVDTLRHREAHPALRADDRLRRGLQRGVVTRVTLLVHVVRAYSDPCCF